MILAQSHLRSVGWFIEKLELDIADQKSNAEPSGPRILVAHMRGEHKESSLNHKCGNKKGCSTNPLVVGMRAQNKSGIPLVLKTTLH